MTNPTSTSPPETDKYRNFLAFVGLALTSWTKVEDAHFELLKKMLGLNPPFSSVIYHSSPSFESRRVLVDRVAQLYLDKKFEKKWTKLNSALGKAASDRGQLAHYGLDFDVSFPEGEEKKLDNFIIKAVHLRPSSRDYVKVMQGKTGEKHTVTLTKIADYVKQFDRLRAELEQFTREAHAAPAPTTRELLSSLMLGSESPAEFPSIPPVAGKEGDGPPGE